MAIPLLAGCDIAGKDITGDALLTQRTLARYIVEKHVQRLGVRACLLPA